MSKRRPNQHSAIPFEQIVQYVLGCQSAITVKSIADACGVGTHRAMKAIRAARDIKPDLPAGPRSGPRLLARGDRRVVRDADRPQRAELPSHRSRRRRELHYVVGELAVPVSRYAADWPTGGTFELREVQPRRAAAKNHVTDHLEKAG